jgi:hypothetical protein
MPNDQGKRRGRVLVAVVVIAILAQTAPGIAGTGGSHARNPRSFSLIDLEIRNVVSVKVGSLRF